jgi:transcriptional regulator with XRE-family HTH domain
VNQVTKAELFEVSIVGVPMNQDSLFEVTGKMLKTMETDAIVKTVLERKGAWVAAAIHNAIYEKQRDEKLSRPDILEALSDASEVDIDTLMDILAGNVTPVPEGVLVAVSEVLGVDIDGLKKLDQGDQEVEGEKGDGEGESESDKENEEASKVESEKESEKENGTENESEKESGGKDTEKEKDFSSCVEDKISKLIAEGKDQDQAVAQAISMCSEGKCQKPSKQDYARWFKLADGLRVKQADQ